MPSIASICSVCTYADMAEIIFRTRHIQTHFFNPHTKGCTAVGFSLQDFLPNVYENY